jgi:hypothetical protein
VWPLRSVAIPRKNQHVRYSTPNMIQMSTDTSAPSGGVWIGKGLHDVDAQREARPRRLTARHGGRPRSTRHIPTPSARVVRARWETIARRPPRRYVRLLFRMPRLSLHCLGKSMGPTRCPEG